MTILRSVLLFGSRNLELHAHHLLEDVHIEDPKMEGFSNSDEIL